MDRAELVDAATELNEVLGLDPEIDVKSNAKEIRAKLIEAAKLIGEEDEVSKKTKKVLKSLNSKENGKDEEKKKEGKAKSGKTIPPSKGSLTEEVNNKMLNGPISWEDLLAFAKPKAEERGQKQFQTTGSLKAHARSMGKSNKYEVEMDENQVKMTRVETSEEE